MRNLPIAKCILLCFVIFLFGTNRLSDKLFCSSLSGVDWCDVHKRWKYIGIHFRIVLSIHGGSKSMWDSFVNQTWSNYYLNQSRSTLSFKSSNHKTKQGHAVGAKRKKMPASESGIHLTSQLERNFDDSFLCGDSFGRYLLIIILVSVRNNFESYSVLLLGDALPSNVQAGRVWKFYKSVGEGKT